MFSTTTEHALRALTYMARLPVDSSILGRDLAGAAGIPANYLSKVLLALRNAGIIAAVRGSGGGYRLRRPAAEIKLVEIVGVFDGHGAMQDCMLGGGRTCGDDDPCTAHAEWKHVRETYTHFLESTSIAQISQHEQDRGAEAKRRVSQRGRRGGK